MSSSSFMVRRSGPRLARLAGVPLIFSLGLAFAAERSPASGIADCQANLTCARQTRVTSARDFQLIVPDLSGWRKVSGVTWGVVAKAAEDRMTGMRFVLVPGACYAPGPITEAALREAGMEVAEVCVGPFDMGVHEVTFEEYDRFARETGRALPDDEGWGRGRRPVVNVNVYDAVSFARWLSHSSGERYRLPTEVEWEHAARAGSRNVYPWGDEPGTNMANCDGCGSAWDGESTAPVGSFPRNAWGLHDMAGNVAEWTCSMRDPDPGRSFARCDSLYDSRRRVYRNGAWSDRPTSLRSAYRDWNAAMRKTDDVGFRLVRECGECAASAMAVSRGEATDARGER